MAYHSLLLLHKVLVYKSPRYMHEKVTANGEFKYNIRQVAECPAGLRVDVEHPVDKGTIRQEPGNKLEMTKNGWCCGSVEIYDTLQIHIRKENTLQLFKTSLKSWVHININI